MPWRAQDFVHYRLRRRAGRPQLKRDPLGRNQSTVLYTLDTNCIIDLERDTEFAPPIRALILAHLEGKVEVAVPAISASEVQKGGKYLDNFAEFVARLAALGLDSLPLIQPITYWGIGFYGQGYYGADAAMSQLEQQIHAILHPDIPRDYKEYCIRSGIGVNVELLDPKWRNAMCDTQALWSHIYHKRHCFVTRDRNFLKKTKVSRLKTLGAGEILMPSDALELLRAAA